MTGRLLTCAMLVTGCLDPDAFAPGPSASLYDNGVRLRVTACPNAGFLSCTPPEQFESASISADGTTEPLERSSSSAPVDVDDQTDPDGIPPSSTTTMTTRSRSSSPRPPTRTSRSRSTATRRA